MIIFVIVVDRQRTILLTRAFLAIRQVMDGQQHYSTSVDIGRIGKKSIFCALLEIHRTMHAGVHHRPMFCVI